MALLLRKAILKLCLANSLISTDIALSIASHIDNKKVMEQLRKEAKERQRKRGFTPLDNESIRKAANTYYVDPMYACRIYGPIEDWNTEKVTDMYMLFCYKTTFNSDISLWDVGAVTMIASMFNGAEAFDQDIGDWQVGAVTHMNFMFRGAAAFNQYIGDWQVGAVTTMRFMFCGAAAFNIENAPWYKEDD
jgi:hypothetical protein